MNDFHGETYIVDIDRKGGVTTVRIARNDGQWYDEDFTQIASRVEMSQVGEVIAADSTRERPSRPKAQGRSANVRGLAGRCQPSRC